MSSFSTDYDWGLNTFELIPEEWAVEIARRGWGRVRVEGTGYDEVMAQCERNSLCPLWILGRGQESSVPSGICVEVGNESNAGCDKWAKLSPVDYAAWVMEAWPVLVGKGCTVYVGAANNTSVSALAWTREVLSRLPYHPQLRVSLHRYAAPDQDVTRPQKGHRSLSEEDAAVLDCVQGRRWAISEAGLVDATTRDWSSWQYFGKRRTRLAVDGHRAQAARFQRLGAEFYVVYQMQDGAGTAFIDRCGIRTRDGVWKATADLPRCVS